MAAKNFMNHFVLIATAIFAICGFILEIVGLSIRQDNTNYNRKNPLGLQWLFFVFYFVTIAAFLACIWKSVVDGYRLLLLALCSIAFVFTVLDCEWALNVGRAVIDPDNGGDVHTAGLILMGISFITWVIVLGAAHNSGLARAADLTLPTHRPGRTQPTHEKETVNV
ncbi:hypothetical protein HK097_001881 [Rhizophlyctis rosea]|uniref:MARVEL domain-containing protein n=1 Tax=Rhizophlyctis rosea TaxID=64517 RepID=A0AAD5SN21_9FUNG|nr:hypothetical protein HK097_001881 [Rhizophlyctis rosea]